MHNTTQTRYNTQNEKQTWRACTISIILPKPIKPKHQTQQNIHRPYSTSYFQIQTKTQNPRNQGLKHEILWEKKITHTFSWRLVKRWWRKWRICERTRWVCKGEERTRQWIVTMSEGKMKSFWKWSWNWPLKCKTSVFRNCNEAWLVLVTKQLILKRVLVQISQKYPIPC